MTLVQILQITGLLFLGCAMRFLLPWIIIGLEAVGRENSWSAWPAWEWRFFTSFLLSLLGYVVMMILIPDKLIAWAQMAPGQLVILAYAGQDVASRVQKPFRKRD